MGKTGLANLMRASVALLAGGCVELAMAADPVPSWQAMQQAVLAHRDRAEVEKYLRAGFDPQHPIGCDTFDALDGAVQIQDLDMVKLLLHYGARPKESTFVSATIHTSPDMAVQMVSAFLAAGADVNSKQYVGGNQTQYMTALHWAAYRQNAALVRLLLAQKGVSLDDVDADGRTALDFAREKQDPEILAMLVQAGANGVVAANETSAR